MALTPFHWFLILSAVLQVTIGLRLLYERELWRRLLSALFVSNAVATPIAGLTFPFDSSLGTAVLLFDGATTLFILFFAASYPVPRRGFRLLVGAALVYECSAGVLLATGAIDLPWFQFVYQSVPLVSGYGAILLLVVLPFLRDPAPLGAGATWIVGAFIVRIVEFPIRYIPPNSGAPPGSPDGLFAVGMVALLALGLIVACKVGLQLVRAVEVRRPIGFVGGLMLVGAALGLVDVVPYAGSPGDIEIARRFSLVVVRPLLAAVGAFGLPAAARLLFPFFSAAVVAAGAAILLDTVLPETGADLLVELLASASGAVTLLFVWLADVSGRAERELWRRTEPRLPDPPVGFPAERWKVLLVALREIPLGTASEANTRPSLATILRVEPRNVHRVVEDANVAFRRMGRPDGSGYVVWEIRRGRGNRLKYYYSLTAEGRRAAEEYAASISIKTLR